MMATVILDISSNETKMSKLLEDTIYKELKNDPTTKIDRHKLFSKALECMSIHPGGCINKKKFSLTKHILVVLESRKILLI